MGVAVEVAGDEFEMGVESCFENLRGFEKFSYVENLRGFENWLLSERTHYSKEEKRFPITHRDGR